MTLGYDQVLTGTITCPVRQTACMPPTSATSATAGTHLRPVTARGARRRTAVPRSTGRRSSQVTRSTTRPAIAKSAWHPPRPGAARSWWSRRWLGWPTLVAGWPSTPNLTARLPVGFAADAIIRGGFKGFRGGGNLAHHSAGLTAAVPCGCDSTGLPEGLAAIPHKHRWLLSCSSRSCRTVWRFRGGGGGRDINERVTR